MKNLLMIVPFFPPNAGGGVFRALSFVKYLGRFGWKTTVVTARSEAYWVRDDKLLEDVPESCDIHRTATLSGQAVLGMIRRGGERRPQVRSSRGFGALRGLGSFLMIPDTYVGWYPFAVKKARRLVENGGFDAMFSTSPPETSHMIGYRVHRATGLPWLADFRDPWTNLSVSKPATGLHARIQRGLERKVCENAAVVVTNQSYGDELLRRYPRMTPATVIPNGYDHSKFERYADLEPSPDRCRILHTGMLTDQRSARVFLEGLRTFLDRRAEATNRVEVLLVGPREDENDRLVSEMGLGGVVVFRDTVPHEESIRLAHTSQILLVIALAHQMPGKFFEYIGARRPILALVGNGEVKDIVSRLNRGETAPAGSPTEIAQKIDVMYDKYLSGTLESDYNLTVIGEYQRESLTGTLARRLDAMMEGGKPR